MTRLRVMKEDWVFEIEVANRTSERVPLWDPELFEGATVRLGRHATDPAAGLVTLSADEYLRLNREHREHLKVIDHMHRALRRAG